MADITPANVVPSAAATLVHGRKAASPITAGQPLYKTAAGTMAPADANGISPLCVVEGIAVNSAIAGQPVSYVTSDPALAIAASGLLPGKIYVASATPGGIAPVEDVANGWFVTSLGVAISATTLKMSLQASGVVAALT